MGLARICRMIDSPSCRSCCSVIVVRETSPSSGSSSVRAIDGNTRLAQLIAFDVDFHSAIYRLAGNPAISEMIAPQWPHMRRSMATVLAELDYRESAWAEHEAIAAQILAGNAKAAEAAALAHAQTAGRMTEERLRATDEAA